MNQFWIPVKIVNVPIEEDVQGILEKQEWMSYNKSSI